MADNAVTIHAARMDPGYDVWVQYKLGGPWFCGSLDAVPDAVFEQRCGRTRPVRVSATDTKENPDA